jgi:3-dehydroquinate synthetase
MRIPHGADRSQLVELMARDKKSLGSGLTFVLLGADGLEVVPGVDPAAAREALDALD